MEEAPENGKESSHSAHADGMNDCNEDNTCNLMFIIHVRRGVIRLCYGV